jgi:hypothetical protein
MRIVIVGGGIGGLSLARELAVRGIQSSVLERAAQLNPVGAGIIMNPNAMRVLERNGLADAVRAESWPYLTRETRDRRGRLLATRDYRPLYESGKLRRARWCIAPTARVLYRSLPPERVRFRRAGGNFRDIEAWSSARTASTRRCGASSLGSHAALHGLPFAPADHGQRRRRAVLHRISRARAAHRTRADLR